MSTILIVDDNAFVRQNVRSILDGQTTMEICGEAKDGENALQSVTDLKPDIVLLDIDMPRMNGLEAAQRIRQISPSTKVVFFSIHPASLYTRMTVRSQGFVSKLAADTELIPVLSRLSQTMPSGLDGAVTYHWQHSVIEALSAGGDAVRSKLEIAEHAIAVRLTDIIRPDGEEQIALAQAVKALRTLRSKVRS